MSTSASEKKPVKTPKTLALPPDGSGGGVASRFLHGVRMALGGLPLVVSDSRLLLLSIVPMIVHVALFVGCVVLGATFIVEPLIAWLTPAAASASDAALIAAGKAVWSAAVVVMVWILVGGLAVVGAVVSASVLCDPFYDAISERTEALFLGRDVGVPFSLGGIVRGIGRELSVTVLRIGVYAVVAVPLWLVSFTPVGMLAAPVSLAWTWLFFSFEFVARSMTRHAPSPVTRLKIMWSHKALFVGFGAVAWLLSLVPLTAPLLVVSATRFYVSLAVAGRVPSTFTRDEIDRLRVPTPTT
jgi:hypothetical protein